MGQGELLSVVTSWICALGLSFGFSLRSTCSTLHISQRSFLIRCHGSRKGSAWSHLSSILLYGLHLPAPANNIAVGATFRSADFTADRRSYSFCAVWLCRWNEGHSYVFSRWIFKYIVSIPQDKFYCGSHCTHQSQISGMLRTPPPPPIPPSCGATRLR